MRVEERCLAADGMLEAGSIMGAPVPRYKIHESTRSFAEDKHTVALAGDALGRTVGSDSGY